jgi:hypothetical protein
MVVLLAAVLSQAQITPSADAYTNTASPTTNFGNAVTLGVESASQTTYIQFDLSSIPSGYTSASIAKATLKLYVNAVTKAGSFNVDFVNGTWSEQTITADLAPALGATIAPSVVLTKAYVHDYILIDVTSALGAWLDGTQANDGIALVANSPLNASFDSKENTTNSQPAELDIVFAGGGTISGLTTASGLTGGGTSGTLSLGLTKSCAANQVLQWNGTSWACSSAGSGTVTSVASGAGITGGPITSGGTLSIAPAGVTNAMLANPSLTVSTGTGLSGGGAVALGSSITLTVDTSKVPELNTPNTFTGNQNVTGNLSASGNVGIGTSAPATQLDIFSSTAGVHTPMARFGSNGAGDSNSTLLYNGTGVTEMFQAGFANAFVTGTQAGDGGLRVIPGRSIFFGDNQGGQRMVISSTGNVLVNSAVPTVIGNTGCGNLGGIGFGGGSLADCLHYSLLGDTVNIYLNRPSGGSMLFRENNATEMVLAPGGNLGIGTVTPTYLLHVNGTARAEAGLSLGGNATLSVDAAGIPGGHFTVLPNGNAGINNNSPQHALDVNGAVSINGDAPMTSNPRMSFSGYIKGSFCDVIRPDCFVQDFTTAGGYFVPDRAINITRVSIALGSAVDPSCNPLPVIFVGAYNLTIPPNTQYIDSGPTPVNLSVTAGASIYVSYTQDDCNVGTSFGGDAWVNVQYEMQ